MYTEPSATLYNRRRTCRWALTHRERRSARKRRPAPNGARRRNRLRREYGARRRGRSACVERRRRAHRRPRSPHLENSPLPVVNYGLTKPPNERPDLDVSAFAAISSRQQHSDDAAVARDHERRALDPRAVREAQQYRLQWSEDAAVGDVCTKIRRQRTPVDQHRYRGGRWEYRHC